MPIHSTITDGIVYTEISGELDFDLVIQHIDFIVSLKDKIENHYELHDFTNIKRINLSSDDMSRISSYAIPTANTFQHACIAIYANNEFTFGMATMFKTFFEQAGHPAMVRVFRDEENARRGWGQMKKLRKLGSDGPLVSAIGYGAMGLEGFYGGTEEESAIAVIRHALDVGCSFIDSADAYGNGHNEQLLGRALSERRSEAFVATKFGIVFESDQTGTEVPTGWGFSLTINGRPDYTRWAIEQKS